MPKGKTHDKINLFFFIFFILIVFLIFDFSLENLFIVTISYFFSSFMLSPDLDLSKNVSSNRWGVFSNFWIFYRFFFKHRGLSHSLIFGFLSRVIYLILIYLFFLFLYYYIQNWIIIDNFDNVYLFFKEFVLMLINFSKKNSEFLLMILFSLYFPHLLHILSDEIYSYIKK